MRDSGPRALPLELSDLLAPVSGPPEPIGHSRRTPATQAPESWSTGRISENDLADLFDLTPRMIRTLAADGVLQKVAPATYDLRDSVRRYAQRMREKAAKGAASDDAEYKAARTRKELAIAEKAEVANAAARGELVRASDVEIAWSDILRDVRAAMLAVPTRVQAHIPTLTLADVDQLDREIRDVLSEVANG